MSMKADPDEPGYRYKIGSHLSAAAYANADSAWHDARRPQFLRADGRIEPAEPVMFVVAMGELGIHFCGPKPGPQKAGLRRSRWSGAGRGRGQMPRPLAGARGQPRVHTSVGPVEVGCLLLRDLRHSSTSRRTSHCFADPCGRSARAMEFSAVPRWPAAHAGWLCRALPVPHQGEITVVAGHSGAFVTAPDLGSQRLAPIVRYPPEH